MNLSHLKRSGPEIRALELLGGISNTDERVSFANGHEALEARVDFPCCTNFKVTGIGKPKRAVRGGEGRGLRDRYSLLAVGHPR